MKFSNSYVLESMKIVFILANSAGSDQVSRFVAFQFANVPLQGFPVIKS